MSKLETQRALPRRRLFSLPDGTQAIALSNRAYTTGDGKVGIIKPKRKAKKPKRK